MGEVYRVRDTKLDRQVALKLVLEVFTADRDRAARFEREARTLAALNHPNIATLHGLEHADGRHFLVMELVEGETLAERIARHPGGLPLEDAFQISETGATFSPDGRWVAYTRDESGAPAMVFVQPFPATGALFQISKSTEDGHHPIWSRDGTELLYTPGGGFISVPMKLSPEIVPGEPVQRPRPFTNMAPSLPRTYDSADGGRIIGLTAVARDAVPVGGTAAPARMTESIQIIVNWIEELKAKVKIQ